MNLICADLTGSNLELGVSHVRLEAPVEDRVLCTGVADAHGPVAHILPLDDLKHVAVTRQHLRPLAAVAGRGGDIDVGQPANALGFMGQNRRLQQEEQLQLLLADAAKARHQQADIAAAERKTAEYEQRIREARLSVYKAQENRRQQVLETRAKALAEARESAHRMVQGARAELEKETATVKTKLQVEGSNLAAEILRIILGRRVEEQTPVGGRP